MEMYSMGVRIKSENKFVGTEACETVWGKRKFKS